MEDKYTLDDGTPITVGGRKPSEPKLQNIARVPATSPLAAIAALAISGKLQEMGLVTESGTPIDVSERARVAELVAERESIHVKEHGEASPQMNTGLVAEFQHLKRLGAFDRPKDRKSFRDQILAATSELEANMVFANATLLKKKMSRRTFQKIENAHRVRIQELASWAEQEKLAKGVR